MTTKFKYMPTVIANGQPTRVAGVRKNALPTDHVIEINDIGLRFVLIHSYLMIYI